MEVKEMSVLVCDDSILSRKKLKDSLKELGCTNITEAVDGEDVVNKYKENPTTIVFLDIVMPKKDGIDALKEILDFDSEAKVIMASSVGTQSYLKEAIQAGAKDFLQKPMDKEQLKKIITNVIIGRI